VEQHKIIFTGPVGAGKTTAINAISDIPTVRTDATATDMTAGRKRVTTVALDFGVMNLGPDERIHLYGTPGQERFDFMWEILSKGAIGLVLLLDNTRADPSADLRFFVQAFRGFIDRTELAVGVTRMDLSPKPRIADYHSAIRGVGLKPPVFAVDARESRDVGLLIQALLYSLDPGLVAADE